MAERELKRKPATTPREDKAPKETEAPVTSAQRDKLKAELDDLLDEID